MVSGVGSGDVDVINVPQEWAGAATIEVYMLSNLPNPGDLPCYFDQVGNFTGPELYGQLYQTLLTMCAADADTDKDKDRKCDDATFPSKWVRRDGAVYCKFINGYNVFFGAVMSLRNVGQ